MEFQNRWFPCRRCSVFIRGLQAFIEHKKKASCRQFIAKFRSIRKPPELEQKPYKCPSCPLTFKFKSQREIHRRVHTGEKPFKCDMCSAAFSCNRSLQFHMQSTHPEALKHSCPFCAKGFSNPETMRRHTMYKHTGPVALNPGISDSTTCSVCKKVLQSGYDMARHKRDVHFPERLPCPECPKQLKSKRILRDHIQAVHGGERPYKCQVCGEGFHSRHRLTRHLTIHETGGVTKGSFQCCYCNRVLASIWNLKLHERRHTGEKPFKCAECGAGFENKRQLKRHAARFHINLKI